MKNQQITGFYSLISIKEKRLIFKGPDRPFHKEKAKVAPSSVSNVNEESVEELRDRIFDHIFELKSRLEGFIRKCRSNAVFAGEAGEGSKRESSLKQAEVLYGELESLADKVKYLGLKDEEESKFADKGFLAALEGYFEKTDKAVDALVGKTRKTEPSKTADELAHPPLTSADFANVSKAVKQAENESLAKDKADLIRLRGTEFALTGKGLSIKIPASGKEPASEMEVIISKPSDLKLSVGTSTSGPTLNFKDGDSQVSLRLYADTLRFQIPETSGYIINSRPIGDKFILEINRIDTETIEWLKAVNKIYLEPALINAVKAKFAELTGQPEHSVDIPLYTMRKMAMEVAKEHMSKAKTGDLAAIQATIDDISRQPRFAYAIALKIQRDGATDK